MKEPVKVKPPKILKNRERLLVDPRTGIGVSTDGRACKYDPSDGVAGLLAALPNGLPHVELLGGDLPGGGDPDGFAAWRRVDADVWSSAHHLARLAYPTLRYKHRERGFTVTITRADSWITGDLAARIQPNDAASAFILAHRMLQCFASRSWQAPLLATPAITGRELHKRTVDMADLPTLPDELADLVRATSGQGRIQLLPEPEPGTVLPSGLIEYDGRRMYTALVDHLPVATAPALHDGDRFVRFQPGRFRCRWQVPTDWAHVGLLPAHGRRAGWIYPSTPGSVHEGWVDAWELQLALDQGWHVDVLQSLTYGPQPKVGPVDVWARKLREAHDELDRVARAARAKPDAVEGASKILRAIMLHTIGAWHGRTLWTTRTVTAVDAVDMAPDTYRGLRIEDGDLVVDVRNEAQAVQDSHPEWSSAVWARARVRLLDSPSARAGVRVGALHVPRSTIVAMRTDAIYLTCQPDWSDDGKPGRLRLAGLHGVPGAPWPATFRALDAMKRPEAMTPAEALQRARATLAKAAAR